MNSKEVKAWTCGCCGKSYLYKNVADECCIIKPDKKCDLCGKPMDKTDYYTICEDCRAEKERIKEIERYSKAIHYTIKSAPKESIEYMFSELYPNDEGFMSDIDDDIIEEHGIEYVYGTKRISPSYDAQDVINSMLEESYEDAVERVSDKETAKLQKAIDTFIKNHGGCLDHYEVDYSIVIDLNGDLRRG